MTNISFILCLFIGHFLGDYYLQSDKIASKETSKDLNVHLLQFTIINLILTIAFFGRKAIPYILFIIFCHILLDYAKYTYSKSHCRQSSILYIADQISHYISILLVYSWLNYHKIYISTYKIISDWMDMSNWNVEDFFKLILFLLIIIKPASITVRKILATYEPNGRFEDSVNDGIPKAGALIGILERLIIGLLLIVGQYAAIGFVLTAKSIARYDKISNNAQFAEYYLLGTLLSTLIVLLAYYLVF